MTSRPTRTPTRPTTSPAPACRTTSANGPTTRACVALLSLALTTACDPGPPAADEPAWPAPGARLTGAHSGTWFGYALRPAGDLDGDGRAELLVGAPLDGRVAFAAGSVAILRGDTGEPLDELTGRQPLGTFGSALLALPDVTGDGRPELVVAAAKDAAFGHAAGRVFAYSGGDRSLLWQRAGAAGDHLGDALALLGDLDGDGHADLLAGAPAHDSGRPGQALVLSGLDGSVLARVAGARPDDRFGQALAGVGDVDGDGRPDLLVGAPEDDRVAERAGRVALLSGADGRLLREWFGAAAFDYLGMAVAGPGDLDADGQPDVVFGVPGDDDAAPGAGSLRAHAGGDGRELWRLHGEAAGDDLGGTLLPARDVDGDGRPDLLAPTPFAHEGRGALLLVSGADGAPLRRHAGPAAEQAWAHAACLLDGRVIVSAYLADDGRGALSVLEP